MTQKIKEIRRQKRNLTYSPHHSETAIMNIPNACSMKSFEVISYSYLTYK